MKGLKVPVSSRALIQRLNRAMHDDDLMVKKTRGSARAFQELGDFYTLDWRINAIMETHVDLEDLAKEYKVLQSFEALDPEEE